MTPIQVGDEVRVPCCGACFEPVIHGPDQCLVMRMHARDAGTFTEQEG